jgi:hypothetical protein
MSASLDRDPMSLSSTHRLEITEATLTRWTAMTQASSQASSDFGSLCTRIFEIYEEMLQEYAVEIRYKKKYFGFQERLNNAMEEHEEAEHSLGAPLDALRTEIMDLQRTAWSVEQLAVFNDINAERANRGGGWTPALRRRWAEFKASVDGVGLN